MKAKPFLITTLGFPGSGKTYFSERLSDAKSFFHLNSDQVRFTVYENPTFERDETDGVFRLMDMMAISLLKIGISVVYDANMNYRIHRKRLRSLAKKAGAEYCLVWIQTDISVAEQRLKTRALVKDKRKKLLYRPIDISILHRLKGQIEEPGKSEQHVVIDGHMQFAKQLAILNKVIKGN